jgi:sec-independent protein translocase protein TatA
MKAGIWELLIVLAIALLIFGPKALPKLGSAMGKTIGNFKKGLSEGDENEEAVKKAEASSEKSDNNGEE